MKTKTVEQQSREDAKQATPEELRSLMCHCISGGGRVGEELGSWEDCPLEGEAHTQFILMACVQCGHVYGFTTHNLDLAIDQGTPETKAKLHEIFSKAIEERRRKILDAVFTPL